MDPKTQKQLIYLVILLVIAASVFVIGGYIHTLQGPDCWTLGNCNF
ncbi:MAG: hypothetical protein ACTSW4_01730 [Candidatus Ranarchaeia archaeon]